MNWLSPRTKLTNVASENMFKDLIAGHARELVNNQEKCLLFADLKLEKRK